MSFLQGDVSELTADVTEKLRDIKNDGNDGLND